MTKIRDDVWTPKQMETLRQCVAEGLSKSQISERLGKSPNAVTGKITRLKLRQQHEHVQPIEGGP